MLEVDLDAQLRFGSGLLVVTDRRLLGARTGQRSLATAGTSAPGLTLRQHDHAGVGHLELLRRRRAGWRAGATPWARTLQAVRLARASSRPALHSLGTGQAVPPPRRSILPDLQGAAGARPGRMPDLPSEVIHTPPSTWTLLRLWRFARPYAGSCWPASC